MEKKRILMNSNIKKVIIKPLLQPRIFKKICTFFLYVLFSTYHIGLTADSIHSTQIGAEITLNKERYTQGMYVILTGTGTPSPTSHGGASVAVVVDGEVLQFDIGPMAIEHLVQVGFTPDEIDYLFLTHLHIDHIAQLPIFRNFTWSGLRHKKASLFGPKGTQQMLAASDTLLKAHTLEFKLLGINSEPLMEVTEINTGGVIVDTGVFKVTATPTPHHITREFSSFAYRVDSHYGSVVITGDTAPSVNVVELAKEADLLIHEMARLDPQMWKEGSPMKKRKLALLADDEFSADQPWVGADVKVGGHSSVTEVGKVAHRANVKKLITYHNFSHAFMVNLASRDKFERNGLSKNISLDVENKGEILHAIKKQYPGPVVIGEPTMIFEIKPENE